MIHHMAWTWLNLSDRDEHLKTAMLASEMDYKPVPTIKFNTPNGRYMITGVWWYRDHILQVEFTRIEKGDEKTVRLTAKQWDEYCINGYIQ